MVKNIALLTGGDSSEWQIALQGAANIEKILDRTLYKPYTIVLRDKHWTYTAPDGTKSELDRNDFTLTVAGEKIKQMRSNYGAEALLLSRCNDKNLIIIAPKGVSLVRK